jgi:hypothetical protein
MMELYRTAKQNADATRRGGEGRQAVERGISSTKQAEIRLEREVWRKQTLES